MRIGFYTRSYPGLAAGGIGAYTKSVAKGLSDLGHTVHVLTPAYPGKSCMDGAVTLHGASTRHFKIVDRALPGAGGCWRVWRAMTQIAREQQLDIVEFPNWEGWGLYYARWRRTPLVVRLHTSSLKVHSIDGTATERLVRWDIHREQHQCRLADRLVTHSEAHRQTMASEYGISRDEIAMVPHGISLPAEAEQGCVDRDSATILHVGGLEHRKGTLQLLQAAPTVLREVPEADFVLVGIDRAHCPGGRTHAQYLRDDFPLEVQQRVHLLGRLSDEAVEDWYRRATVFVGASIYESFGLTFIEAMRWGTPVVGTTGGAIPEVVENGRSGLLVAPSDSGALAQAIISLLKDERRRREFGEAARQRVKERFSVERMAADVESLFTGVVKEYRVRRRGRKLEPIAS